MNDAQSSSTGTTTAGTSAIVATATTAPASPTSTPVPAPPAVVGGDGLQVPTAGINVPVTLLAVEPSGNLPGSDPNIAMIYTWEAFPQYGGLPGQGNTVLYGRRATPAGPAIFYRITDAKVGDAVQLRLGGTLYEYAIVSKCRVPIAGFESIVERKAAESLTIITDDDQPGNTHRIVVVAERRPNSLPRECRAGSIPL
jgi:LPXTG-site transpeptidase (sortase) family protein